MRLQRRLLNLSEGFAWAANKFSAHPYENKGFSGLLGQMRMKAAKKWKAVFASVMICGASESAVFGQPLGLNRPHQAAVNLGGRQMLQAQNEARITVRGARISFGDGMDCPKIRFLDCAARWGCKTPHTYEITKGRKMAEPAASSISAEAARFGIFRANQQVTKQVPFSIWFGALRQAGPILV